MKVPENGKDKIRGNKADGIEEYDNPLPRWWVGLFYLSIVFAFVYMIYLHVLGGKSLLQELEDDHNAKRMAMEVQPEDPQQETAKVANGEDLSQKLKDPALLAEGKDVYSTNCFPCHGAQGEGTIGPNLTDEYWIHGGSDADVVKTIAKGVPEKGMIAWEPIIGRKKVESVAAYVLSMQGTNPPNPKAPQGTIHKRN